MICEGCVFRGVIAERKQEVCGLCEDPIESVKACVAARVAGRCDQRMDRADVRRMVEKNEELERQRDAQRAFLEAMQRVIAGVLEEGRG